MLLPRDPEDFDFEPDGVRFSPLSTLCLLRFSTDFDSFHCSGARALSTLTFRLMRSRSADFLRVFSPEWFFAGVGATPCR